MRTITWFAGSWRTEISDLLRGIVEVSSEQSSVTGMNTIENVPQRRSLTKQNPVREPRCWRRETRLSEIRLNSPKVVIARFSH